MLIARLIPLVLELRQGPLLVIPQLIARRSLTPSLIESIRQPLVTTNNINKLINNDTQSGCDIATVELSQTMDNFQQQQTGRLL